MVTMATVAIIVRTDSGNGWVDVDASRVDGGLAVTRTYRAPNDRPWKRGDGWTVTHIASGKVVARFGSERIARRALRSLVASGVDWRRSGDDVSKDDAARDAYRAALTVR